MKKLYQELKKKKVKSDKVTLGELHAYDKQIGGSHYQKFKIQPSKFVIENELLFPEGCAIKYICRHRLKGKKEDILKAIHFLEMILERDYNDKKDFLEEAEKEKKELEESYKESVRQTKERKEKDNSWGIITK